MENDNLSDDVFVINNDELTIDTGKVQTVTHSGGQPSHEALKIYAHHDYEDNFSDRNHENYFYPDNAVVHEGWKSYKIEDDEPFGSLEDRFDDTVLHKVIMLGDSGVGKTSFLVYFNTREFKAASFSATVGVALTNKIVTVDQTRVKLQIWDTAGQERFRSVTHAYYRDAHALLLLYDVTNKITFDNTRAWLGEIREYAHEDVVIMLLGNKADCGPDRQVRREDGERLAREYNVAFMETSAKTGLNVDLAFLAVAKQLKSHKAEFPDDAKFNVQEYVKEQTQRPSCPSCL